MTHEYEGIPLSFGAGVNSVALAVLLAIEGWHGPIVFADTGTEWPETMAYLDMFGCWLAERGLEVTVLGGEWRREHKAKGMSLIEYCESYRVTPFPGTRWCTSKWKVEPLHAWCAANGHDPDSLLIGIAAEESRRQSDKVRPLVDRGIDRNACARIIQAAGLEVPRKSGCYICPFQSPRQWRDLWETHPDLFERAERLERLADERRAEMGVQSVTHLGASRATTLRQMADGFASQGSMFEWAAYYQPCMCRL